VGTSTDLLAAASGMASFTVTADSGTNQTITNAQTLDIAGGTNITTTVADTDTVTINLDSHNHTMSELSDRTEYIMINEFLASTTIEDGDGEVASMIPVDLNNYYIISMEAKAVSATGSDATTVTVEKNGTAITGLTVTLNTGNSWYASDTPTSSTQVATGDILRLSISSTTGTATGLVGVIKLRKTS